jgi:molybdate transport system substrate-binding protein
MVVAVTLLAGCERKDSGKAEAKAKELLLYCGAGIRPPADELAETFKRQFGVEIAINYAGSETLLSTIRLTRSGDLYMPGDKHYVEQAAQQGMILSQRSVCYFVPTILVQKGNPKDITNLQDLLKPGVKLGLGDPNACAIGRTTRLILAKNNIAWDDVKKNLAFQSLTVNELGMQIQAQSLDAAILWDAMAEYYSEYGDQVPIATEKNVISTVDVGVLAFTKHRGLAERFVDFLTSNESRSVFEKYGYRTEPPE